MWKALTRASGHQGFCFTIWLCWVNLCWWTFRHAKTMVNSMWSVKRASLMSSYIEGNFINYFDRMHCDFAVLWFDERDFEFVLLQNRSTSRRRIKPLVEAEECIARNIDKDCVEKRYIDENIGNFPSCIFNYWKLPQTLTPVAACCWVIWKLGLI